CDRELRIGDLAGRRAPGSHRGEDLFRGVHDFLAGRSAPTEDDDAENDPRDPGAYDFAGAVTVIGAVLGLGLFALEGPDALGMPDHQEADEASHRDQGGNYVHQPGPVMIGDPVLRGGEGGARYQNRRPDLDHFGKTDEGPDQPEGNDEREHWQDAACHGSQSYFAETRDSSQGDDR